MSRLHSIYIYMVPPAFIDSTHHPAVAFGYYVDLTSLIFCICWQQQQQRRLVTRDTTKLCKQPHRARIYSLLHTPIGLAHQSAMQLYTSMFSARVGLSNASGIHHLQMRFENYEY